MELAELLDKLKARNPGSMRETIKATIRDWLKKDQKGGLELKLDRCRDQLNLGLVNLSRSESLERLNKLIAHGQASGDELRSLTKNVESLRLGCNVSYLGSEALNQIRSLLKLTDNAVLKVRQGRVLDGLRFELMNERFEDIKKAHQTTFDWIFSGHDVGIDGETELDDDSSFEWVGDDTDEDRPTELASDEGNSIKNLSPSRSSLLDSPNAEYVSNSVEEDLIKARNGFITWLEQDTGIFHISGKPGSGKSTLMKYLTRHPKIREHLTVWADGKKLVLGSFFFWKPGSVLQKSIKGLVRGMLHCILEECPDLIPFSFPMQWEASIHREKIHIEHHQCQQAFENIVAASQTSGEYKIALFIDGLDEFEGNHSDLIRQLLTWTNGGRNVKLCVSSREWAIFQDAFRDCPKFRLHDLTRSDIRNFVRDRFGEMHINTLLKSYVDDDDGWDHSIDKVTWLRDKIVEESAGVFLWVSLVLRHIEEGLVNGDRFKDLIRLIDSLPTDLELMFQQLLESIPRNNRRLAYSMLSLARFCSKHSEYSSQVFVIHYSFLEEYIENKSFAMDSDVRLFTARENSDRLERTRRRIYGICKGLLELSPKSYPLPPKYSIVLGCAVRLIHRSITEFLDSQYFIQGMEVEYPDFDPFDAYCQTYLRQLQRVRFPTSYFVTTDRLNCLFPFFINRNLNEYLRLASGWASPRNPPLSFRQDIESRVLQHIATGRQEATSHFYKFLDATDRALGDLRINLPGKRAIPLKGWYSIVDGPQDLITLGCAQLGFYEYFILKQNIKPELVASCASVCLLGLEFLHQEGPNMWSRVYKTLEALFDRGASPDSSLIPGKEPAFHAMLKFWCYRGTPNLAAIAFMLYHGVNPSFTIFMIKSKYQCMFPGDIFPSGIIVLKACCQSELLALGPGRGGKTIRASEKPGVLFVVEPAPEVLDVDRYGYTINLRTLVSLWYPSQSAALQQVIDWIVELGVPVNAYYRSQLQGRFGSLLRPFFDPDHPEFIGFKINAQQHFPGHSEEADKRTPRSMRIHFQSGVRSSVRRYREAEKKQNIENR